MFEQIRFATASESWLREADPQEKHRLLCLRLGEAIDGVMAQGMNIQDATLQVRRRGIAITLMPEKTMGPDVLATEKLSDRPKFMRAFELLLQEESMENTTPVTDAVEEAFNDLADEILRQIFGDKFLRKLGR